MKIYSYLTVFACTLFMCVGQILFKIVANALQSGSSYFEKTVFLPFFSAIIIYGLSTLAWVWALQYIPLSRAFPFVAISYILIPIASWFFFEEQVNMAQILGSALIMVGVVLTSIGR